MSACSGQSVEDEIYDHLEEAVQLESVFGKQQDVITDLEQQERKIFDQIIDLEMKNFDQIKELAQEALILIEDRSKEITTEKESIDDSKNEFEKSKELIQKLEDETVKKKAEEMYNVMIDRYTSYANIHKAYIQSLKEEEALYNMFQSEDVTQEQYTDQTNKVNESYEIVIEENKAFNEETSKYNELKKEFYDLANFNVTYEKN